MSIQSAAAAVSMREPAENSIDRSELLAKAYTTMASLPEVLCPASPQTPRPKASTAQLRRKITDALAAAGGDPTDPRWDIVARLIKLRCTSRGYVGVAPGVKIGEPRRGRAPTVRWALPETEEEWLECERKWGHKFQKSPPAEEVRTSKYWPRVPEQPAPASTSTPVQPPPSESDLLRKKITAWQASIAPVIEERESPAATKASTSTSKGKGKEMDRSGQGPRAQSALTFSVVKRSNAATTTKAHRADTRPSSPNEGGHATRPPRRNPNPSSPAVNQVVPHEAVTGIPPLDTTIKPSPDGEVPDDVAPSEKPPIVGDRAIEAQAAEVLAEDVPVAETAADNFPNEAPTAEDGSTGEVSPVIAVAEQVQAIEMQAGNVPALDAVLTAKETAEEISASTGDLPARVEVLVSTEDPIPIVDSTTVIQPDVAHSNEPEVAAGPSRIDEMSEGSFLPPSFPTQLGTSTPRVNAHPAGIKHKPSPILPRSLPSSPLSSPTQIHPAYFQFETPTGASKKRARSLTTDPIGAVGMPELSPPNKKARADADRESSSSAPPLPSTPSPLPQDLPSRSLGNAKGLRVPTTPTRKDLPTLTELLASSRRSRPRPRPPSRRAASRSSRASTREAADGEADARAEADAPSTPAQSREASPARTYFSSPASGSGSDADASPRYRAHSPMSPLFSQASGVFAPPFVSSQPGAGGLLGLGAAQGGGAYFGMGYSSQFDVEGQVDRVSELLERDVDYDGWLRDIPEEESRSPVQS
ncbi:hypothetical protein WOLCODRAFT_161628 [Wolfiporia cocos MD-104 SS10]|uniref:Uncharacterized protein n=1 Tax=Wolfiporia cocos (strain MD-104) TaxID=742152 RepID=A0A2H3J8H6_WOLCO|nr:hypothetical protein WOLCODRAFT_161628 [Wolfiporia cocos MD-104 SS10]